ncbi:MAG: hypothetical protein ACK4MF_01775 [Hyphomicrobiaceae bacterium]
MLQRLLVSTGAILSRLIGGAAPIFRLLAAIAALTATIALTNDVMQRRPFTSTVGYWQAISPTSYASTSKAVGAVAGDWAWRNVISLPLGLPAFVLFGTLAVAFGYWGRRRRRVQIYVN